MEFLGNIVAFILACLWTVFVYMVIGIGLVLGVEIGARIFDALTGMNLHGRLKAWIQELREKREAKREETTPEAWEQA